MNEADSKPLSQSVSGTLFPRDIESSTLQCQKRRKHPLIPVCCGFPQCLCLLAHRYPENLTGLLSGSHNWVLETWYPVPGLSWWEGNLFSYLTSCLYRAIEVVLVRGLWEFHFLLSRLLLRNFPYKSSKKFWFRWFLHGCPHGAFISASCR